MSTPVDPARIDRARKGDAAAFEALVDDRVGAMTRTAMAILGRDDEALDAARDALVTAWREMASLRDPAALDTWLARILVARCKRGRRSVGAPRAPELPAGQSAVTGRHGALERAFDRLAVGERTILVLHHVDGCSRAAIAVVLGTRADAVEPRLLAARGSLDQALAWEDRLVPSGAGRAIASDDALEAMLRQRADRLPPDAAATVKARMQGELGPHRSGGILGLLPIGERAGSMSGLAGWGAAIAAAVLVTVVLGGRHIDGAGATPGTSPVFSAPAETGEDRTPPPNPCESPPATAAVLPGGTPSAGAPADPAAGTVQPAGSCGP